MLLLLVLTSWFLILHLQLYFVPLALLVSEDFDGHCGSCWSPC